MKGYEVVTSEGERIGRVAEVLDAFLVVEVGRVLRFRRPLPKEFAHAQDGERTVVVTVPTKVLRDAPRVHHNGTFDVEAAARHYGLASGDRRGEGHEQAVAEQRERESAETGAETEGAAPLTKQPDEEVERRPERVYMPGGK